MAGRETLDWLLRISVDDAGVRQFIQRTQQEIKRLREQAAATGRVPSAEVGRLSGQVEAFRQRVPPGTARDVFTKTDLGRGLKFGTSTVTFERQLAEQLRTQVAQQRGRTIAGAAITAQEEKIARYREREFAQIQAAISLDAQRTAAKQAAAAAERQAPIEARKLATLGQRQAEVAHNLVRLMNERRQHELLANRNSAAVAAALAVNAAELRASAGQQSIGVGLGGFGNLAAAEAQRQARLFENRQLAASTAASLQERGPALGGFAGVAAAKLTEEEKQLAVSQAQTKFEIAEFERLRGLGVDRAEARARAVKAANEAAAAQELQARLEAEQAARETALLGQTLNQVQRIPARSENSRIEQVASLSITEQNLGPEKLKELQAEVRLRVATEQRAALVNLALLSDRDAIPEIARTKVLNRELNRQIQQRVAQQERALYQERLQAGGGGVGTRFQRFQAALAGRQGRFRDPEEFQQLGQFFSSKALTTVGFAASGVGTYAAFQGIQEIGKETVALERNLTLVEDQLRAIGQESSFRRVREDILAMARDTGIAASEVANIRLQLQGAFGGSDFDATTQFIDDATEAALRINKITGLTAEETTDSLTAIAFSFGKTFEEIGDYALGLRDRFGVLSREIITAAADVAPVAAEAGLSFEETSAIVAAAQRAGGRSGSALAEAIGRILPSIPSKAVDILEEFNVANLEDVRQQLVQQIAEGDTGQVLIEVIKNFQSFNETQQKRIVEILGERRESPTLLAFLRNAGAGGEAGTLVGELDRIASGESDVGRLDEAWSEFQNTLAITFGQLSESLRQIGIAILDSGLVDFLTTVVGLLGQIVGIIPQLTQLANIEIPGFGGNQTQFNVGGALQSGLLGVGALNLTQRAFTNPGAIGTTAGKIPGIASVAGLAGPQAFLIAAGASFASDLFSSAQASAKAFNESFEEKFRSELAGLDFEELTGETVDDVSGLTADVDFAGPLGEAFQLFSEPVRRLAGFKSPQEIKAGQIRQALAPRLADRVNGLIQLTDEQLLEAFSSIDIREIADPTDRGLRGDFETFQNLTRGDVEEVRKSLQDLQLRIQEDPNKSLTEALTNLLESSDLSAAAQRAVENAAQNSDDLNAAIDTVSNEEATRDLELAKARFEAGQTGALQYFTLLEDQIAAAEELVAAGVDSAETNQQLAQNIIARSDFLLEQLGNAANIRQTFADVSGDPQASVRQEVDNILKQLDTEGILTQEQLDAVLELPGLIQEIFEDKIAELPTAAGRQQAAERGFELPYELLRRIFDEAINTTTLKDQLDNLQESFGTNTNQILNDIYSGVFFDGLTVGEAAGQAIDLDATVRRIEGRIQDAKNTNSAAALRYQKDQLDAIQRLRDTLSDPTGILGEFLNLSGVIFPEDLQSYADDAKKEAEELADAITGFNQAKARLAGVAIEDSPILVAALQRDQAEAAIEEAKRKVEEAETEIEKYEAGTQLVDALADRAAAIRDAEEAVSDSLISRADTLIYLAGLTGDENLVNQVTLEESAALFTDPAVSLEGQEQAVRDYLDTLVESVQLRIDAAETDAEKLAIAQAGIQIPESREVDVQRVLLTQTNAQFKALVVGLDAILGDQAQGIINGIVAAVLAGNDAAEATKEALNREITRLKSIIIAVNRGLVQVEDQQATVLAVLKQINAIGELVAGIDDSFGFEPIDVSAFELPQNLSPGTGGLGGAEDVEDIAREIAEAKLNLAEALVGPDNAYELARIEQDRAALAFQYAENEADRINAEADRIRADRSIRDAIYAIADSYVELAIAIADVAGDTVEVAQLQLQLANDAFARAVSEGAGQEVLNQLQADQVRAAGRVRDAQLQEQQEIINFNLEMGKISKQQAIAQLEALVAQADILGLTEQQVRDLLLQIKQLRDDANANLQFNIPSEIQLPTLYEVRRTAQGGGFQTFTDNRQINVQVNIAGSKSTAAEIGDAVGSAVANQPRQGINPKLY